MNLDLNNRSYLKTKCESWDLNSTIDRKILEDRMISIMIDNDGIGLAANQVGLNKRVFVIGGSGMNYFQEPIAIFNPVILEKSQEESSYNEGCLSYKDLWITIKRPSLIKITYENSNKEIRTTEIDGLAARCFQHEYDHLDGICFIDIVSKMKLQLAYKKMRKILDDRTKRQTTAGL